MNYIFPLKLLKTAGVGDLRQTDRSEYNQGWEIAGKNRYFVRLAEIHWKKIHIILNDRNLAALRIVNASEPFMDFYLQNVKNATSFSFVAFIIF